MGNPNNTIYIHPTTADHNFSVQHDVFIGRWADSECEKPTNSCQTCFPKISEKVQKGFNTAGGLGLFFSFPELFGALVACRYRNLMDPFGAAGTGLTS